MIETTEWNAEAAESMIVSFTMLEKAIDGVFGQIEEQIALTSSRISSVRSVGAQL